MYLQDSRRDKNETKCVPYCHLGETEDLYNCHSSLTKFHSFNPIMLHDEKNFPPCVHSVIADTKSTCILYCKLVFAFPDLIIKTQTHLLPEETPRLKEKLDYTCEQQWRSSKSKRSYGQHLPRLRSKSLRLCTPRCRHYHDDAPMLSLIRTCCQTK